MTAPPSRAPTATAPVFKGAAFGLVAVACVTEAALVTELMRLPAELVMEAMADVMEARSEPVAVESSDDSDATWLLASAVIPLTCELTAELMDAATLDECVATELAELTRDEADDAALDAADEKLDASEDVSTLDVVRVVVCWACGESKARLVMPPAFRHRIAMVVERREDSQQPRWQGPGRKRCNAFLLVVIV
jgi:hypothetical protein